MVLVGTHRGFRDKIPINKLAHEVYPVGKKYSKVVESLDFLMVALRNFFSGVE